MLSKFAAKCGTYVRCAAVALAAFVGTSVNAAEITHERIDGELDLITISGTIESGDDDKFRTLSLRYKRAVILLDSEGGMLLPAIEIGKMVRIAGYSTLVLEDTTCTSSCALIWLAGAPRFLDQSGKVGFHASYRDNNGRLEETGVGNAMVGHYLTLLNLSQKAIVFATMASPQEISWLSVRNRDSAGIEFSELDLGQQKSRTAPAPIITPTAPPPIVHTRSVAPPVVITPTAPRAAGRAQLANMTVAEMTTALRATLRDPVNAQRWAASSGLGPEYQVSIREHMRLLYSNDRFVQHLATQLHASRGLLSNVESGAGANAIGMKLGQEIVAKLSLNGMSRLDNEAIKSLFYYYATLPTVLSPDQCQAVFAQKTTDPAAEFKAIARLGHSAFVRYLALVRRGVVAELTDYPLSVPLNPRQAELSKSAFDAALLAFLESRPEADKERLANAMLDLDAANAKDSCDSFAAMFKVMYDLDGITGEWLRRDMLRSMGQ